MKEDKGRWLTPSQETELAKLFSKKQASFVRRHEDKDIYYLGNGKTDGAVKYTGWPTTVAVFENGECRELLGEDMLRALDYLEE